jgi:phosphoglycolate phosphatase-like HAD superfamily hydrolase
MPNKRLLVCDLDNTLYDWVGYFVPSFYAMVDAVVEITRCDREKLLDDFRAVHQKHGDSEQPFALLETDTIQAIYRGAPPTMVLRALDPAFHAFNSARKENLKLHPQVRETLDSLRAAGITLIAHTESKLYGVVDRLTRLDLTNYFSKVYCRKRSVSLHPDEQGSDTWLDRFPMSKVIELSHHQTKPNREILLEICANELIDLGSAAYVGDSVARDMLMAKRAGVFAIWAAYGAEHSAAQYGALVRVSHWTAEEVAREQLLKEEAKSIKPDYVAHSSFAEVAQPLLGARKWPFRKYAT